MFTTIGRGFLSIGSAVGRGGLAVGRGVFGGLGSVGRLVGFGGVLTYLLQGYTQFRIFKEGSNLFSSAKNFMGVHFHKYVESNPFINFFFISGIIVFITSLMLAFVYKVFGITMNKKIKTYILLAPFFVVFAGIIYAGYVHNLRTKDVVYSTFSGANTEGEVATIKTQQSYSHVKQKSYEKDYVFNSIGKNLSEAFYADMCRELSYDDLNARVFKEIKVKGYYKKVYKMNVTPLMWAAYIGNTAAVSALLKSGKVNIRAVAVTRDWPTCQQGAGWFFGVTYLYKTTHTPYSIAYDNGHSLRSLIKDASIKAGYKEYKGLYDSYSNKCNVVYN